MPKTFYNSALLSRLFVSLCLGSGFSHLFVVSSEFLFGRCVCHCLVAQSCPTRCHPMDCKPTRLLCLRGFSRQEYWSGLPSSPPGDLPDPEMEPTSPALAGRFFTTEPPGKPLLKCLPTHRRNAHLSKCTIIPGKNYAYIAIEILNKERLLTTRVTGGFLGNGESQLQSQD